VKSDMVKAESSDLEMIEVVAFDGAIWCTGCLPKNIDLFQEDVFPILKNCGWGMTYPVCLKCGHEHRHITL